MHNLFIFHRKILYQIKPLVVLFIINRINFSIQIYKTKYFYDTFQKFIIYKNNKFVYEKDFILDIRDQILSYVVF